MVSFRTRLGKPPHELRKALNALIGPDILIRQVAAAASDFDARRSAQSRRYGYAIWNSRDRNVWERRWMAHVENSLDVEAMDEACRALLGRHDFAAFRTHRSQDDPKRSTVRRVLAAAWRRDPANPNVVRFEIEADAFLRHMVRSVVGSAILVGQGKLPVGAIGSMLAQRERAAAGPTAPAHGLTLLEIRYEQRGGIN